MYWVKFLEISSQVENNNRPYQLVFTKSNAILQTNFDTDNMILIYWDTNILILTDEQII